MYLYVEMWNVTEKWMELSKEKRRSLMDDMEERIKNLKAKGFENLGWALNDEHTHYRSDYMYFTVWKIPSEKEVPLLEDTLKRVGWYDYFSQANSRGKLLSQSQAIDFLINLEKTTTSLLD